MLSSYASQETSVNETTSLDLPFTPQAAVQVLKWGARPEESPYTHRQIAEWCDRFWCEFLDVDAPGEIERLLPILADVDAQWDLFLANTYSFEELRSLSLDDVQLPVKWFQEWLRQAKA
jgi:hypothetical protein